MRNSKEETRIHNKITQPGALGDYNPCAPIKGIWRAQTSHTLPTPVSFFLDDLRATLCLLVTMRAQPKFNSLVAQGKWHFKLDSRKSREILDRKSVIIFPISPMSRLGLRTCFKTNGQSRM